MAESLVVIDPNITDLKTGTPVIKYGDSYIVAGIGGDFIPGGIGAKPQGVWDVSVSYFRRDAVTYEGAFYVAIQDNIGVTPGTDNTKWLCYVEQGPEGPEGSVFVPSVSSEGVISWTKKESSEVTDTPESVSIRGPQGEPGEPLEANYIDITTVTDGYLVIDAETIPVSVEINNAVYPVLGMVKENDTFKIPTDPILAATNLAEYTGTWRVWRAGGRKGDTGAVGPQGQDGAEGADGYTPQKGVDYWTAEDISAIQAYCEEQIVNNAW